MEVNFCLVCDVVDDRGAKFRSDGLATRAFLKRNAYARLQIAFGKK